MIYVALALLAGVDFAIFCVWLGIRLARRVDDEELERRWIEAGGAKV